MTHESQHEPDTDQLIWEYLDGGISEAGAARLSSELTDRPEVRERFVDSAMLHGMLIEHYRGGASRYAEEEAAFRKRRRKHGRSSAA